MIFNSWFDEFSSLEPKTLALPKILKTGKIKFVQDVEPSEIEETIDQGQLPFGISQPFTATATLVSRFYHPTGKQIMLLDIEGSEMNNLDFEPGDTFGILPKNSESTVCSILKQLNIDNGDKCLKLENSDPKKQYLPNCTTIRRLLTHHVNFKSVPMKQMLVTLADYTSDPLEKSALQFLSSKEGAEVYKSLILDAAMNVFTLFTKFSSCCPPVEILIEILPRLLPRPYSVASSKLEFPMKIRIALSVLPFEKEGVCTGMFRQAFTNSNESPVQLYLRKPNGFRLPVDENMPLILVGPGTGVAPFLGFLDQMKCKNNKRIVYLFTGFQYKENYFCIRQVEDHLENGFITKLFISYSREFDGPRYVQDTIKENWQELGNLILNNNASIYECGDFKKMPETIYEAFTKALAKYMDLNLEEAKIKLNEIKTEGRYLQDIWC